MLETLIESLIYRQITIAGLNFITSVNCKSGKLNSFFLANLFLNSLVVCLLILKVFADKRTINVHIEVYTISESLM